MLPSLGGYQMEYAFSLVLQDFVHATEVSYEDTREFIIICPSCHEHVRKIGSEVLSRQYFAHFPLKGNSTASYGCNRSSKSDTAPSRCCRVDSNSTSCSRKLRRS